MLKYLFQNKGLDINFIYIINENKPNEMPDTLFTGKKTNKIPQSVLWSFGYKYAEGLT